MNTPKKKILFLCTGNSCRSQMAEGWAKAKGSHLVEAYSAGTSPHGMNSEAIATMKRAGIDITSHTSDHVDQYLNEPIDIVISVCDNARDTCPDFPGQVRKICKTFPDPPAMAKSMNSQVEVEACYDQVRNEIERYVSEFLETLA